MVLMSRYFPISATLDVMPAPGVLRLVALKLGGRLLLGADRDGDGWVIAMVPPRSQSV
jgi:hypothetical protein